MPLALTSPTSGLSSGSASEILFGTGLAIPPGLEAILEFNGLYLNDRSLIDTYVINSLAGLEDADLRDDREVNPQDHGETAFDSFYGGRTITIGGYVRAFEINKLRDMQQALKQAFSDLTEMPLIFHSFDSPDTDCLIYCRKGAPLQMAEVQPVENWYRRDFLVTLRASNLRFLSLHQRQQRTAIGIVDTFDEDSESSYDVTGTTASVTAGKWKASGTAYNAWIRNDLEVPPSDHSVALRYDPASSFSSSFVRLIVRYLNSTNYIFGQVDADHYLRIYKLDGGVTTQLAVSASPLSRSLGTPYWISILAIGNAIVLNHYDSEFRLLTQPAPTLFAGHTLAGANAVKFGTGIYGDMGFGMQAGHSSWTIDDVSIGPAALSGDLIGEFTNLGNFNAQPVIEFSNALVAPILTNIQSGKQLQLTGSIIGGDSYTIDIANRTMTNALGNNKFGDLAFDSEWLDLEPGVNQLTLAATSVRPVLVSSQWRIPEISLIHRDSWV